MTKRPDEGWRSYFRTNASGHILNSKSSYRLTKLEGVEMAQITGGKFIAEALKAYGVTHVFVAPAIAREALAEMIVLGVKSIVLPYVRSTRRCAQ